MKDFLEILLLAVVLGIAYGIIKVAGIVGGFLVGISVSAWLLWNLFKEHKNVRKS